VSSSEPLSITTISASSAGLRNRLGDGFKAGEDGVRAVAGANEDGEFHRFTVRCSVCASKRAEN
jgi:hypothetical protein